MNKMKYLQFCKYYYYFCVTTYERCENYLVT